jgi:hypothetical protein
MGQEDIRTNRQRKRQRQKEAEIAVLSANSQTIDGRVVKGFRWESAEKRLQRKALKRAEQEGIKSKKNLRKEKKKAKRKATIKANMGLNGASPETHGTLDTASSNTSKEHPEVNRAASNEAGVSQEPKEFKKYEHEAVPAITTRFPDIASWKNADDLQLQLDKGFQHLEFGENFKTEE